MIVKWAQTVGLLLKTNLGAFPSLWPVGICTWRCNPNKLSLCTSRPPQGSLVRANKFNSLPRSNHVDNIMIRTVALIFLKIKYNLLVLLAYLTAMWFPALLKEYMWLVLELDKTYPGEILKAISSCICPWLHCYPTYPHTCSLLEYLSLKFWTNCGPMFTCSKTWKLHKINTLIIVLSLVGFP